MPNIIVELTREIMRVDALLPKLDAVRRREAENAVRMARDNLSMNFMEGIRDSITDLREFGAESKK